jgi:hypothetical protein
MSDLFKTNFVIVAAPLDPTFNGGPQELFDAMIENMEIQAPTGTNFFVVGDAMPTSNVGPWLKGGDRWYVFDDTLGTYVPLNIDDSVTQVFVTQEATPDAPADGDPSIWLRTVGTRVIAWYFWDGSQWRPGGNTPPSGPTDSRPTSPVELETFWDTDINCLIHWERGAWRTVSGTPGDLKFVSTANLADAITQNPGWIYAGENLQAGRGRVIGLATKDPGASPAVSYVTDSGVSSRAQGDVAGEETHVLTSAEIESHSHVVGTSTALNSDNNIYLQRVDDGEGPSAATPLVVPSTKPPNYFEVKGDGTTDGTKNGTMPDPGLGCMLITSRQFKLADAGNYTSAATAHNNIQPTIWLWALQKT